MKKNDWGMLKKVTAKWLAQKAKRNCGIPAGQVSRPGLRGVGCAVVTYAGKRNGQSRASKIDMLFRQSKDNNGRLLEMGEWGERGRGAVCDTCNAPELLGKAEAPIFKLFCLLSE